MRAANSDVRDKKKKKKHYKPSDNPSTKLQQEEGIAKKRRIRTGRGVQDNC